MSSVFSVDDFSDPFWQSPPSPSSMNRSASDIDFEKYLEEFSVLTSSAATPTTTNNNIPSTTSSKPNNAEVEVVEIKKPQIPPHPAAIDSEEYRAFLKAKLDLACAVVAKSRTSVVKPEGLNSIIEPQSSAAENSPLSSQAFGHDILIEQSEVLPAMQRKQDIQVRQTTSGSSREDSEDDEVDGETETNEHADPADAKRARRMLSNRESARRSRRRKQAQLGELETQVGQLRDERTSLLSRYTDINKRCDDAAVDNRILKANIETLRTKVKMAEEQVKRVTGLNPMLLARSNVPSMGMQYVGGQVDVSTNIGLPMQPNSNQFFHQPVPNIAPAAPHLQIPNSSFCNNPTLVPHATNLQTENRTSNVGKMNSIDLTATGHTLVNMPSMQQVQKQIGTTVGASGALPLHDSGVSHSVAKENERK